MAFYLTTLTAIQTAITAKLDGGAVDSYSLPDGTEIRTVPLEDLLKLEERYRVLADQEAGESTRCRLVRTRPR